MKKVRLVLESLDNRVLPSASLANGVLSIDGTDGRDVIVLRQVKEQLGVRGQLIDLNGTFVKWIPLASVTQIAVATGAGDDFINLTKAKVPTSVNAGEGKDVVIGGANNDMILGGAGDDRLAGMRGDDDIFGGADNDRITGGRGNDQLYGEEGDDRVFGENGDDDNDGGTGNDLVRGGLGKDYNQGGGGVDVVHDGDDHHTHGHGHDLIEGMITAIDVAASVVTIHTQNGDQVEVHVGPNTAISWNHNDATLDALQVGDWAVAKLDPNGETLSLDAVTRDGWDHHTVAEGIVTAIDVESSVVTIQIHDGTFVDVNVGPNTIITRNDHHVTLGDFFIGDWAKATLDSHGETLRIDARSHYSDHGQTSVEGIITAIDLHHSRITIQQHDGTLLELIIDHNAELLRNHHHATLASFQLGDQAKATFDANGVTILFEATGA